MPPLAAVVLGFGLGSGFSVHAADSQNSTKSALLDTAGFAATANEDAELAFPEILRHEDVDLYRQIFDVQEDVLDVRLFDSAKDGRRLPSF